MACTSPVERGAYARFATSRLLSELAWGGSSRAAVLAPFRGEAAARLARATVQRQAAIEQFYVRCVSVVETSVEALCDDGERPGKPTQDTCSSALGTVLSVRIGYIFETYPSYVLENEKREHERRCRWGL